MSRRRELAAKRAMLVARCELQRHELTASTTGLAHSLRGIDTAIGVARRAASHPLMLAGVVVAAIVIIRPRRLLPALSLGLSTAVAALATPSRVWTTAVCTLHPCRTKRVGSRRPDTL